MSSLSLTPGPPTPSSASMKIADACPRSGGFRSGLDQTIGVTDRFALDHRDRSIDLHSIAWPRVLQLGHWPIENGGFRLDPSRARIQNLVRPPGENLDHRIRSGRRISPPKRTAASQMPSPSACRRSTFQRASPSAGISFGLSCRLSRYSQITGESSVSRTARTERGSPDRRTARRRRVAGVGAGYRSLRRPQCAVNSAFSF